MEANNVQEMRDALVRIVEIAKAWADPGADAAITLGLIIDRAESALAVPVRNCDRFATVKDAAIEFSKLRNNPHPCPDFVFSEWLLAIAAEGGANA
jgi:hypothetical protein